MTIRFLLALVLPTVVLAQNTVLKVDVNLVTVNVRVTDTLGRSVVGLEAPEFQLWEDRIEQSIYSLSIEDVPASIGLVLDVSGSMEPVLREAQQAGIDLLQMGTKEDEIFLITFSKVPQLQLDFTKDISKLSERLLLTHASGSTALWDAMRMAVQKALQGSNSRRAVVCITDGGDNYSRFTEKAFADLMREKDVQIYYLDTTKARKIDAERIATSLKSQYLLTYRSTNELRDGKWRDIRVRVKAPPGMKLVVNARPGYYSPQ